MTAVSTRYLISSFESIMQNDLHGKHGQDTAESL